MMDSTCDELGSLGSEDDTDITGGPESVLFGANPSAPATATVGETQTISVITSIGGGSQTNGTFPVAIGGGGSGVHVKSIVTSDFDGWSASGWTYDSSTDLWSNTFTKGAVTASYEIQIEVVCDVLGELGVFTDGGGSVRTDQVNGGSGHITINVTAARTFEVTPSVPATQDGSVFGTPVVCTLSAVAGGAAQTSGSFYVTIYDNYGFDVISSVTTSDLDGWTQSGWVLLAGVWKNHYTRAAVPVGTTTPTVSIGTGLNTGIIFVQTTPGTAAPQTAQAAGIGGSSSCHLMS